MIKDTKEEAVVEEAVEEVENAAEAVPPSLTIQDLSSIRNIIDVASQRGAFRTNEFTVVGATYTKLNDFVNSVAPAAEPVADADGDVAEEVKE